MYSVAVLMGVVLLVFFLFNVLPVDASSLTIGQSSDEKTQEAVRAELGLDKPIHIQLLNYINDISPISLHKIEDLAKYEQRPILSFKDKKLVAKLPYLRNSYQTKRPVWDILAKALPQTLLLAFVSIVLASVIGIALGSIAAVKKGSIYDELFTLLSTIGISVPSFFSALVIGFVFGNLYSHITGLNQIGGLFEISNSGQSKLMLKNLILPALALGIRPVSIIYQLARSSMLDVLSKEYIRTAYAKGLSSSKVIVKHALRNALNPVVTSVTGWFASLLAGAFFVEVIFNIKGIGYVTIDAMQKFDFPVVMGSIMVIATVFVLANFLADMLYAYLDPRIRR